MINNNNINININNILINEKIVFNLNIYYL